MPKRFLEDMVLAKRRQKEIEEKRKSKSAHFEDESSRISNDEKLVAKEKKQARILEELETKDTILIHGKSKFRPRYYLWFVALVSVVFCFFAVSFLFAKAEITVNPKMKDFDLNESLSANLNSNNDNLPFNLVAIDGEENKNINVVGEKDVATKATGVVIVYNNYNTASQALAVDTRLEGSNGKIYKTQVKVVVPGKSKSGTPGSVEVNISGTNAGGDYNSDPIDFKILGFKGTPKYAAFYGRSKGPISGGFKGKVPDLSDAEKATAENEMKTNLRTKLLAKAADQIPEGFILFKDAIFLDTSDLKTALSPDKDTNTTLSMKGTLYGFLFNEKKLTEQIAKNYIEKNDTGDVYISNMKDLSFSLSSKDSQSFRDAKNINFNLAGKAKFVWRLDADKFTADLLGRAKKDFSQVLSQYADIDSAEMIVSPMWKMSVPDQAKDVKIIVNYPQ